MATNIASRKPDGDNDIPDHEDHEPDDEKSNAFHYHTPIRKIADYFKIADAPATNGTSDRTPLKCTFASRTTAIHLATKPHLRISIDEAATLFHLPDLRPAIHEYLDRCANGGEHSVEGRRRHLPNSNSSPTSERIQVWTKVRVQVRNYHHPEIVEPAQTVNVIPPSPKQPHGLYDSAVFSPRAESDWPSGGLEGNYSVFAYDHKLTKS